MSEVVERVNNQVFDLDEAFITEFHYNNEEHGRFVLPVVIWGSDIWFFGQEALIALQYENNPKILQRVCENRFILSHKEFNQLQKVNTKKTVIHVRGVVLLPEEDFYLLIMRSRAPYAVKFQKWVTSEVLPSIRKAGGYQMLSNETKTHNRANDVQQLVSDVWNTFELYEKFGYPQHEAAQYASKLGEDVHGINVLSYTKGPPPQDGLDMSHEASYLRATEMAKYLEGLEGPKDVNKALNKLLLTKRKGLYGWEPTPKGYEYGGIKHGSSVRWHRDNISDIRELWRQEKLRYGGIK